MSNIQKTATVAVILATYNGEKYLAEQLASLSAQTRRIDVLVLRDDGSTDNSVTIVREWARTEGIVLQEVDGPRLGPARSFLFAVQQAREADIFLFCDQDDFWEPYKVQRAVAALKSSGDATPALYASRLGIVDAHLNPIRTSVLPTQLSFASATCESLLTGCTMAFNGAFRALLAKGQPRNAVMHDWWCYLLATGCKNVSLTFDPTPTLKYRQHSTNAIGAGPTGLGAMRARITVLLSNGSAVRSRQLREFHSIYADDLRPDCLAIVDILLRAKAGVGYRLFSAFRVRISRQSMLLTLTTRFAILTNRF